MHVMGMGMLSRLTQLEDARVNATTIADTMARDSCDQKEIHAMRLHENINPFSLTCNFSTKVNSIVMTLTAQRHALLVNSPDPICLVSDIPLHSTRGANNRLHTDQCQSIQGFQMSTEQLQVT